LVKPVNAAPTTRPEVLVEARLPDGFPPPGVVGQVVVKQYPACRVVRVKAGNGGADGMFGSLFNHISSNKIPMTSPVVLTWTGGNPPRESSMAFVYGSPKTGRPGPDGDVEVVDVPAVTVISVGVRGDYDAAHFDSGMKQLQDFLAGHAGQYSIQGPPRYLAYNSPFVPWFAKFGEVQIPVEAP
jgi:hypothetical protein